MSKRAPVFLPDPEILRHYSEPRSQVEVCGIDIAVCHHLVVCQRCKTSGQAGLACAPFAAKYNDFFHAVLL